jgi:predicted MFS family arabinose efflux permease
MAFAVLYLPLVEAFGASRGETATVQGLVLLLGGMAAPLIGHAFDRLGPRRLLPAGAAVAALGMAAASQASSLGAVLGLYGVVAGLGLAAIGSQTNMVIAALWYPAARARAVALADLGTGLGAFCFVPLGQTLVGALGWRATLLVWAALLLALVVPTNLFQHVPAATSVRPAPARAGRARSSLAGALGAPAFWWLAATRFFSACAFPVVNTHAVAYAIGQGVSAPLAATALGSVSLVSLAGRMTTGMLADRIGRAPALTVMFASAALGVGCLGLLALHGSPRWLWAFVVLFGMAQGSSGIVASARAADVFAGPTFGVIYGWLALAVGPGEALGVWAAGAIFDRTGSYLPAFALVVVALAAGLTALWRVRPGAEERGAPSGALV